jgi:hypothetical protein
MQTEWPHQLSTSQISSTNRIYMYVRKIERTESLTCNWPTASDAKLSKQPDYLPTGSRTATRAPTTATNRRKDDNIPTQALGRTPWNQQRWWGVGWGGDKSMAVPNFPCRSRGTGKGERRGGGAAMKEMGSEKRSRRSGWGLGRGGKRWIFLQRHQNRWGWGRGPTHIRIKLQRW